MLSNFLPKNGVYTSQKLVESCGVEKGREGKKEAKARTRFHNNKGNFEAAKNPERKKKKKRRTRANYPPLKFWNFSKLIFRTLRSSWR